MVVKICSCPISPITLVVTYSGQKGSQPSAAENLRYHGPTKFFPCIYFAEDPKRPISTGSNIFDVLTE
jgi:hypothetical protein